MKKAILVSVLLLTAAFSHANPNIQLPEMGDSAGALVSPLEEYQVGQNFFWQLQQQVDLIQDPELNDYIKGLGNRLVASSDAPSLPFTFFMVSDPSINAFAAPGGFIGVHSGLMLTADTEDEIASVMAHEIAHVTQRHILRSYERGERLSVPLTAAMIAAALLGIADPSAGSAAIMAVQGGAIQMQLDYSRAHESEADSLGMQTLAKAGFDPYAMPSFFEKLQVASRFYGGGHVPEFLRTHPITGSRIAETRARAENYPAVTKPGDNKHFYLMREKLRVMTTEDLDALTNVYRKKLAEKDAENPDATRYGYVRALIKANNHTAARQALMPLIEEDGDRLTYQLALADIEMAVGNTAAALSIYEDYQGLYPDDRALSMKQVEALLRVGEPRKAANILQRQLDVGESSKDLYRLLGKAHEQMGNKSESHMWLAEAYYHSGQLAAAADQLRIAADFARGDEYQRAKISSRLREVETQLAIMENNR
ncbi:MAG TPA: M48 family metalloprotease [Methylophaga sp.]|nr:M48 family metalloprotease [Methylophaga sp.]